MKQSNPNWAKDLTAKLDELGSFEGKVGWFDNAKEEDGTHSATVAIVQEYGANFNRHGAKVGTYHVVIPPRLGMRETIAKKDTAWRNIAAQRGKKVMEGTLAPKGLVEGLVLAAKRDFFKRINSNPGPPLKESTKAARRSKGRTHEQTMVDTARMLEQLETKVEKV